MVLAVGTTHTNHPQYWILILNHISSTLQNTMNILEAFNRLIESDKESVLSCQKMKTFIMGSFVIAELGIYVSTSCLETMVHQNVAEKLILQCQLFVTRQEVET